MPPIYLGFVGPIASGKGVAVDHLKDLGFHAYSLSDVVREETNKLGLELLRENLQNVGDNLRLKYGNQILAERVLQKVTNPEKNLVFDSIRNPGEIEYLRLLLDIKIISIEAPIEKRIVWYLERAKKRGEDNPDMTAFITASLRDGGFNQVNNGQQVEKCIQLADLKLQNNGSRVDLNKEIDYYLKTELQFDPEIHRGGKEK